MTSASCDKPAVSILMSVYNGAPYLGLAIDSVLKQTYRNLELVIVDDGSTDESPAIINKFKCTDSRIRSFRNERNLGLVASLNRGLAACQAELVARADSDDIFRSDRIQIQLDFMKSHPEVGVIGSAVEFIDQNGAILNRQLHSFPTSWGDIRLHSLLGCCLWHTTVMFRKTPVDEAGRYSTEFVGGPEDYDLWARLLDKTQIVNLPLPLAKQRLHSASITAQWKVGYSMYCTVAQRLLERYLGRKVSHSEATAIVSMFGCDGDLENIDCQEGFQILSEILSKASVMEERNVFENFRDRCGRSLLRQAGFVVYTKRKLSWQLMHQACQTLPRIYFEPSLWLNLLRTITPASIRTLGKRIMPG